MKVKDIRKVLIDYPEDMEVYIDVRPSQRAEMEGYDICSWNFEFSCWDKKEQMVAFTLTEMVSC